MAGVILTPAVGVTASIVRHRMFDIDRLVARTLSYALVTLGVVGIYLGAVVVATTASPSLGDSDLVVALSTLGAGTAFRPLRRRVQTVAAELVATSSTSLRPASISLWTGTPTERGNGSGTLATYNGA